MTAVTGDHPVEAGDTARPAGVGSVACRLPPAACRLPPAACRLPRPVDVVHAPVHHTDRHKND
ncbi:hypothetical protein [Streptomyces thermoviolaceus]|uniref:hypothetical protein n=1 Tax=Streptomyces thermoviolaceus TaxID=1952 RepID=UPI0016731206|nr:hypothetical protein [Streptomyces thermoviolaceus]WTD47924.1 hypothetical protein OG899_10525 [Streptomyces thermoviolaceus]GGV77606.1 hypothetical protein GCM10010499_36970 [Streptomyces thermoviolaceus subsp. apingens]